MKKLFKEYLRYTWCSNNSDGVDLLFTLIAHVMVIAFVAGPPLVWIVSGDPRCCIDVWGGTIALALFCFVCKWFSVNVWPKIMDWVWEDED